MLPEVLCSYDLARYTPAMPSEPAITVSVEGMKISAARPEYCHDTGTDRRVSFGPAWMALQTFWNGVSVEGGHE